MGRSMSWFLSSINSTRSASVSPTQGHSGGNSPVTVGRDATSGVAQQMWIKTTHR